MMHFVRRVLRFVFGWAMLKYWVVLCLNSGKAFPMMSRINPNRACLRTGHLIVIDGPFYCCEDCRCCIDKHAQRKPLDLSSEEATA